MYIFNKVQKPDEVVQNRIDLADDFCEQFISILLYILGSSLIFKMLVKTFHNNEKNGRNIVKLNQKQNNNLYC